MNHVFRDRRTFHMDYGGGMIGEHSHHTHGGEKHIERTRVPRVEGEMGFTIHIPSLDDVHVHTTARINVVEPPRFLREILRNRHFTEGPTLVARICGICPTAHIIGFLQAVERGQGVTISRQTLLLRKLMVYMALLQSHSLQLLYLIFPDLFGMADILSFAQGNRETAERLRSVRDLAYAICKKIGGGVLPITFKVGGMANIADPRAYTAELKEFKKGLEGLEHVLDEYVALLYERRGLIPDFELEREFISLRDPAAQEYALYSGDICSSVTGMVAPSVEAFLDHTRLYEVPNSTTLWTKHHDDDPFMVGPLARHNNQGELLTQKARDVGAHLGLTRHCMKPCYAVFARIVECLHVVEHSIECIAELVRAGVHAEKIPEPQIHPTDAVGVTEAPRGLVYYRLALDAEGRIQNAQLVIPTGSNFAMMQRDLGTFAPTIAHLPADEISHLCDILLRDGYDPCNSCAVNVEKARNLT